MWMFLVGVDLWVFAIPGRQHYHLSLWYDTVSVCIEHDLWVFVIPGRQDYHPSLEGMCQCFHLRWNDDSLSYNSVNKRSNKARFGLHLAETTKVFWRQLCNNYQNNQPISMKISAVQSSRQDTCFHHKYFCYNIAIERGIIILHPPHQSTL